MISGDCGYTGRNNVINSLAAFYGKEYEETETKEGYRG